MENQLKRHRSKHSRGPVCLRANSQALGKLIWAEWNTNTLFMEIRPINKQSSWFKEPSTGLAIKVLCSSLSSSPATFLSGKTRADKKVLLVGCLVGKGWNAEFCLQGIKLLWSEDVCAMKCQGISFVLFQFFLIPGFSFFHSCYKLFHSCQAARSCSDTETQASLGFCSAPLYHVFIPLNPRHCKMLSTLPQCILMVFLQLGLLPRYSLRLLAKPFGVLTKCLPRLLLRNVHMHMRVMNNASSHARGFGVQVRLNAWLSANERGLLWKAASFG